MDAASEAASTGETDIGRAYQAGLADVASLPFRDITTMAQMAGEIMKGAGLSKPGGKRALAEKYLQGLERTGGKPEAGTLGFLAEEIARDPGNITLGMGLPARLPVALTEAGLSAALHQAQRGGTGQPYDPAGAATEVGLAALPYAVGGLSKGLRKGAGGTMRTQLPVDARKQVGDVADIMDITTSRPGKLSTPELKDVLPIQRKIALAAPDMSYSLPDGGRRLVYVNTPAVAERVANATSLDDIVKSSELIKVPGFYDKVQTGLKALKNGITEGWTRSNVEKTVQEATDHLEKNKRALINLADEYALTKRAMGKSVDVPKQSIFDEATARLMNDPMLAPSRPEIRAALERAVVDMSVDYPDQLLPSQLDQFKRVAGKEAKWLKKAQSGNYYTAVDPNATARERVYSTLYDISKKKIEKQVGGDLIKQYNATEHELIPFLKGLEKADVKDVGIFGRLIPMIAGGTGGLAGAYAGLNALSEGRGAKGGVIEGLTSGLSTAALAGLLGMAGKSTLVPRAAYMASDVLALPAMASQLSQLPGARQALRTGLQAGEGQEARSDKREKDIFGDENTRRQAYERLLKELSGGEEQ
jgi:hypothetical protein